MKKLLFALICMFIFTLSAIDSDSLKTKGLEAFTNENYPEALDYINQALKINQQDPELYYYYGFFLHYQAYDSRPLQGYDYKYSAEIFKHLKKALELKTDYGDAKYFYGAECSVNAFNAMQNYDEKSLKKYYKMAEEIGAYPDWLKEFGRNLLNSCDKSALLFTGGNADFDICMYLQLHENLRKDITLIPLSQIERPWYVKFLKSGLKNTINPINIQLTDAQIEDLRPFKWKNSMIRFKIPDNLKKEFDLKNEHIAFELKADLKTARYNKKIEIETLNERDLLSIQRAMLFQIIENNWSNHPVFFSNCADPFLLANLDDNLQNYGLVSRLSPINFSKNAKDKNNHQHINLLLQYNNLIAYYTIKKDNIPRISNITSLYLSALLIEFSKSLNENKRIEAQKYLDFYKTYLMPGLNIESENNYLNLMENSLKP